MSLLDIVPKVPSCQACGRVVVWAESIAGVCVAFDPEPVRGADFLLYEERGKRLCQQVSTKTGTHQPHRRSCPKERHA